MKFKIITVSCLFLSLVACNGGGSSSTSSDGGSQSGNPSSITASQFASNIQVQINTIEATGQTPFLVAFDQEKNSQQTYFMSIVRNSGSSTSYELAAYNGDTLSYFINMPVNFSPVNMQVSHGTLYFGGWTLQPSPNVGGLYSFNNGSLQKVSSPFDSCNSNCGIGVISLNQDGNLLIGGWSDSIYYVYEYQPLNGIWTNLNFTQVPYYSVQGITYQGKNILIGGTSGTSSNSAHLYSYSDGVYTNINSAIPTAINGGISAMTTHNNIPRIAGWKKNTETYGGYSLYRLNGSLWQEINVPQLSNPANQLNNLVSDSFGNIYGTIWTNPGQDINTGIYLVESAS